MSNEIVTFGDAIRVILDAIVELKSGKMDVSRGMAIAANMKVLNDSIHAEINAAKLSLQAAQVGKNFGDIMRLGKKTDVRNRFASRMIREDLQQLIANCDDDQCEIIAGIVLRVISIRAERWTGNLALSLNAVSGVVADMHVNRGEVVRLRKRNNDATKESQVSNA